MGVKLQIFYLPQSDTVKIKDYVNEKPLNMSYKLKAMWSKGFFLFLL